jgi:hypothetical protein
MKTMSVKRARVAKNADLLHKLNLIDWSLPPTGAFFHHGTKCYSIMKKGADVFVFHN